MRKTVLSTLVVALLLAGASTRAFAQGEMKPFLVVSLAGYQRVIDDLAFVGRLSDNPDLAKNIEAGINFLTQDQGLAGLDKARPWGLAASTDGAGYQILAFVSVTDVKKLLDALGGLLGNADLQDGVYKVQSQSIPIPLFIKEANGYAFISQSADGLSNLPKEPAKLLAGLDKQYDIAVRLNLQNIPIVFRQMAIDHFKMRMDDSLQQLPGETDAEYEQRSKMIQEQMDALVTTLNELDDMTFGFTIDEPGRRTFSDFSMTAVEGTKTAKQMVLLPTPPSKFAGFVASDAAATLHINSKLDPDSIKQSLTMLKSMRAQVLSQIDDEDSIGSAKVRGIVKDIVGQVLDVVSDTVMQGTHNGGGIMVGDGPFTFVFGGSVSDGGKLDGVVKKLAELAKSDGGLPADALKLNADKHKDVTFHTLKVEVPEDADNADVIEKLLGKQALFTVAVGKQSVYLAAGDKGIETIKKVIDKSEGVTETTSNPIELTVKLAPLLKMASEIEDANPILGSMAASLKDGGKDKVRFTASGIKNGQVYRLEAEEGILKLIGSAAKLAAAQGGVGAF